MSLSVINAEKKIYNNKIDNFIHQLKELMIKIN